jgi:hypothetical protein
MNELAWSRARMVYRSARLLLGADLADRLVGFD